MNGVIISKIRNYGLLICLYFATPCTVALQAPLSGDSPGKNTRVDCHALLQEIFPTWASKPGLSHCR